MRCLSLSVSVTAIACSDSHQGPSGPEPPSKIGRIPAVVASDVSVAMRAQKISQLVGDYDRHREEPTHNQTYSRYQLRASDLGISFQHDGRSYFLFGDSHGAGQKDGGALAYSSDATPEDGISLTFLQADNGAYQPLKIPGISQGAFEVPTEGVSVQGSIYVYHTTDYDSLTKTARSVVVRSNDGGRTFTHLYDLSDESFIHVSIVNIVSSDWNSLPERDGEGLIIFGSGSYRESKVYLAYQHASAVETPEAIRYFAGVDDVGEPLWSSNEGDALPVYDAHPCVGELSATYNRFIERWILLYNCSEPRGIHVRTAAFPWGPWSSSQVVFHPWEDDGYCHFVHVSWERSRCDGLHDPGRAQEWGGEYGPYQLAGLAKGDTGSTTIYFTMSTWNPYTVVLMRAGLERH